MNTLQNDFVPRAWAETYTEFTRWLRAAGITVAGLPDWSRRTAVHVVAVPGMFFIERISEEELEAYRRIEQREGQWVGTVDMEQLQQRRCLRVTAVDPFKLEAWQQEQGGVRA